MSEYSSTEAVRARQEEGDFPEGLVAEAERFMFKEADYHAYFTGSVFLTGMFFPLQRMKESDVMLEITNEIRPRTIMEIGIDKSGGFYRWPLCVPTVQNLIGCEVRGTPCCELFERKFPDKKFLWLEKSSYDPMTVKSVKTWFQCIGDWDGKIDVLFIDGEKAATLFDFDAYLPLMSKSGIVFIHDIQDESPGAAFQTIIDRGYKHTRIIDTTESAWLVNRKPKNAYENWIKHWNGRSCGVGVVYMEGKK
jgi:hypothetical protein